MRQIIIRQGWLLDKFALEAIGENALGMFGEHNCSVDIPERALDAPDDYRVRVALEGHNKLGYSMAQEYNSDLYLRQLFVRADANHSGIGSALMKDLIAYAQDNNFKSISLLTSANAPWSVPFYKKFGFEIHDCTHLPIHIAKNLMAAAETPAIKSIPNYLPIVGMIKIIEPDSFEA
jgi:GNAT superfamily N-acetyltransferase